MMGMLNHGLGFARLCGAWTLAACFLNAGTAAASATDAEMAAHVARARALMQELREESRHDARRIEEAYRHRRHTLPDREALAGAIADGSVRFLPLAEPAFNIRPRLTGAHPIGELDREHQRLYVAADPAALGLLLQIAARVRSTPLDVTSLVRHDAYQRRLGRTNANARTSLPTHTLGVAFDISILNVPYAAAREIRDVLRRMRAAGDLFFIAEVQQLVFHVVVAPERAPFHAAVYDALAAAPPPAWRTQPLPSQLAEPRRVVPIVAGGDVLQAWTAGMSALPSLLTGLGLAAIRRRRRGREPLAAGG